MLSLRIFKNLIFFPLADGNSGWRCPACQNVSSHVPNAYTCFCGEWSFILRMPLMVFNQDLEFETYIILSNVP